MDSIQTKPDRRRFRFSLRTMMILVTCSAVLIWDGTLIYKALRPPSVDAGPEVWRHLILRGTTRGKQAQAEKLGIEGPLDRWGKMRQLIDDLEHKLYPEDAFDQQ